MPSSHVAKVVVNEPISSVELAPAVIAVYGVPLTVTVKKSPNAVSVAVQPGEQNEICPGRCSFRKPAF